MMKIEESEEGLDEWKDITMSPRGGLLYDHSVSRSFADIFSVGEGFLGGDDHGKGGEVTAFGSEKARAGMMGGSSGGCVKSGVSIAERRAVKCGFNAAKISTPRFRTNSPLPSPGARSPFLTIPAGISPQMLLDSPMFLPNSQLSPTTGTLVTPPFDGGGQMVSESPADADNKCNVGLSSMYNPHADNKSLQCFHDVETQGLAARGDYRPLNSLHQAMDFEFPVQFPTEVSMNHHDVASPPDRKVSDDQTITDSSSVQPSNSYLGACVQMPDKNEPSMGDDSATCNSVIGDQKGTYPPTGTVRTAEDGYNWRKYGQKQVKGSEYPRSYYKCTHPNCQVKKKVERSHDGHITEIIYKGGHDHPQPQPCRKSAHGSLPFNETSEVGDYNGPCVKAEGGIGWRNIQADVKIGSDWRVNGLERTSSASVLTEVSDPLSNTQVKPVGMLEPAGTPPEFSSTVASHEDEEEDAATQGNLLLGDDHENEPDSRKRKKDACFTETTLGSRAAREPRVVVQIESEVDILDDGYRWRKYGQKVVKGNPNPRSYYKCTSAGCNVRKHVERASHNLKFVITTYEGKHNHEVPAARNSSHANSGSGSSSTTTTQSNLALPRNSQLPKPEPHSQDLAPQFDATLGCSNDILRQNFLGAGTPPLSFYQMKFPTLPNTSPYGAFGLTNHHPAYTSGMMPAMPDISVPLPQGFPRSIPHYANREGPLSSLQFLYAGQQPKDSDLKLVQPKLEQRDDSFYGTDMHLMRSYPS